MKLYLSSYKLGNDIELLKEWVKNNNKMLVIPNALDVFEDSERKTNGILDILFGIMSISFFFGRVYFVIKNPIRTTQSPKEIA